MILSPVRHGTDRDYVNESLGPLQLALTRLEVQLSTAKLVSFLTHELSQPLGAITNYTQGCKQRLHAMAGMPPEILGAMDRILVQASRTSDILRSVGDHVQDDRPALGPVVLDDLVSEVGELLGPEAQELGVAPQVELSDDLPPVRRQSSLLAICPDGPGTQWTGIDGGAGSRPAS